jgi:hypothetical protein
MKKKPEARNLKLEALLKTVGFTTLENRGPMIVVARGAMDFSKAHATVLQNACTCPEYLGCSEFPSLGKRTLIVHRRPAVAKLETGNLKPEEDKTDPSTSSPKPKA